MSAARVERRLTADINTYRYQRFTTSLLFRDLRFHKNTAGPGDVLPQFELVTTDGNRLVNRDVFDDKPVLFVFGSMTCPNTASAAPSVQTLYEKFGDRVRFIMVYVREAHPGEYISQAETIEEKMEHARALRKFYSIEWTVAADNLDGDLHRALEPKPNSAVLMNSDGTILFRSLWAADRDAMHQAVHAVAAGRTPEMKQSSTLIGPVTRAIGQVQAVMERGGPQAVRDLMDSRFSHSTSRTHRYVLLAAFTRPTWISRCAHAGFRHVGGVRDIGRGNFQLKNQRRKAAPIVFRRRALRVQAAFGIGSVTQHQETSAVTAWTIALLGENPAQ